MLNFPQYLKNEVKSELGKTLKMKLLPGVVCSKADEGESQGDQSWSVRPQATMECDLEDSLGGATQEYNYTDIKTSRSSDKQQASEHAKGYDAGTGSLEETASKVKIMKTPSKRGRPPKTGKTPKTGKRINRPVAGSPGNSTPQETPSLQADTSEMGKVAFSARPHVETPKSRGKKKKTPKRLGALQLTSQPETAVGSPAALRRDLSSEPVDPYEYRASQSQKDRHYLDEILKLKKQGTKKPDFSVMKVNYMLMYYVNASCCLYIFIHKYHCMKLRSCLLCYYGHDYVKVRGIFNNG